MAGRHQAGGRYAGRHRSRERSTSTSIVSLAAVTLLTAAGGGVAWWEDHQPAPARVNAQSGTQLPLVIANPSNRSVVRSKPIKPQKPSSSNKKLHHLRDALIVSTDSHRSWIVVATTDGQTLVSRMLEPHHTLRLDRHHLKLTVGSAGAVKLIINGRRIAHPGHIGEVARYSVR